MIRRLEASRVEDRTCRVLRACHPPRGVRCSKTTISFEFGACGGKVFLKYLGLSPLAELAAPLRPPPARMTVFSEQSR